MSRSKLENSKQHTLTGKTSRRSILATLLSFGVSSSTFARALLAQIEPSRLVTPEMIRQAEWIAGLQFTKDDRNKLLEQINRATVGLEKLRAISISNSVPPALMFRVEHSSKPVTSPIQARFKSTTDHANTQKIERPTSNEELAFFSVKKFLSP